MLKKPRVFVYTQLSEIVISSYFATFEPHYFVLQFIV